METIKLLLLKNGCYVISYIQEMEMEPSCFLADPMEIIDGEFKGLVYQYGKVQFEDGKPHLNFQRTIRRLPEDGREVSELENSEELNTLMGDILVELMQEQIERDKGEQGNTESTD